jgi:hypothetical protein
VRVLVFVGEERHVVDDVELHFGEREVGVLDLLRDDGLPVGVLAAGERCAGAGAPDVYAELVREPSMEAKIASLHVKNSSLPPPDCTERRKKQRRIGGSRLIECHSPKNR